MKIAVIGGGNIGTLMAAEFARNGHEVVILSSRAEKFEKQIEVYDKDEKFLFAGEIVATKDYAEAVTGAKMIWVTMPAECFPEVARKLEPVVSEGQIVGIVPGSGGAEFVFKDLVFKKGCILAGLARVHSIARLKEYGRAVYELGKKAKLEVGTVPASEAPRVAEMIAEVFQMPCEALENYLSVTLTPSNPILHTTRLYTMFKDYNEGVIYPENRLFYEGWDDASSEMLIACDGELQRLCQKIPLDLSAVQSLCKYYESEDAEAMTRKLTSIPAFRGILSPMKKMDGAEGWVPDFGSRYFATDFPYGLKIIKDLGEIYEVKMPNIDKIWEWYCDAVDDRAKELPSRVSREGMREIYGV